MQVIGTGDGDRHLFCLTLFRFGVNRFERQLNRLLDEGWKLKHLCVHKFLLRMFMHAQLVKPGTEE